MWLGGRFRFLRGGGKNKDFGESFRGRNLAGGQEEKPPVFFAVYFGTKRSFKFSWWGSSSPEHREGSIF